MIKFLAEQFSIGFREGWAMFWSPFVAPAHHAKLSWMAHVGKARRQSGDL
jgi:hypothetical protein